MAALLGISKVQWIGSQSKRSRQAVLFVVGEEALPCLPPKSRGKFVCKIGCQVGWSGNTHFSSDLAACDVFLEAQGVLIPDDLLHITCVAICNSLSGMHMPVMTLVL